MRWLAILIAVIITGCNSVKPEIGIEINSVSFVNATDTDIKGLEARVAHHNSKMACGYIPDKGLCSVAFQPRPFLNNPFNIRWQQGGRTYQLSSQHFVSQLKTDSVGYVSGVVTLNADGSITAYLYPQDMTERELF